MSNKVKVLLVTALCLGATVGYGLLSPREPKCDGQTLDQWLPQFLSTNRPAAEAGLRCFGTNALPRLQRRISAEFSFARTSYRALWPNLPLVCQQCLTAPSNLDDAWHELLLAVQALGPAALPTMADWLHHPDAKVRTMALLVLRGSDPVMWSDRDGMIRTLIELVQTTDPRYLELRGLAASVLGHLGPLAKDAIPAVVQLEKSALPSDRGEAAAALRRIQRATP